MDGRRQRRQYPIVNRDHQYRFLAYTLAYCMFIVAVFAVTMFIPDIIRMQDPTLPLEVRAAAAREILTLHTKVWPVIVAVVCFIAIHSSRMFHRFVGPLHRFTQVFKEIAQGRLFVKVTLREDDLLETEKVELNRMIDMLVLHLRDIREESARLDAEIQEWGAITDREERTPEEREKMDRIVHASRAMCRAMGFFQLPEDASGNIESAT